MYLWSNSVIAKITIAPFHTQQSVTNPSSSAITEFIDWLLLRATTVTNREGLYHKKFRAIVT